MQFICEGAQDLTWFRIDSESEAAQESSEMNHAVVKHFCQARAAVEALWKPPAGMRYIEQDIGKKDFVERGMPLFATLRDAEGKALATAMLPTGGPCLLSGPLSWGMTTAIPIRNSAIP